MKSELPFLLNEYEISKWAYEYCSNINDDPKVRKFITNPYWAFIYCLDTKDDPEVRKNTTNKELLKDL